MENTLTPEQVKDLRIESFIKRQNGNVVRLGKLADRHEALREQDEAKSMENKRLREQLAEAQADVRALVVIAKQGAQVAHAWACRANNFAEPLDDYQQCGNPGCKARTTVLARPGVKRVMEEQGHEI